jgi:polysaccharide biosynthesis/export protein
MVPYFFAIAISLQLAACSGFLPSDAPTAKEFRVGGVPPSNKPGSTADFIVADLTPPVVEMLDKTPEIGLTGSFQQSGYTPNLALRPGEVVSITIFDQGPVSLFGSIQLPRANAATTGGNPAISTTLPQQVVEVDGSVTVPFAGRVRVGGLTPLQASDRIARALVGIATNPQVVVSQVGPTLNTVTVGGDVNRPGLVPLTMRGERILDAIAASGGARYPTYDSDVRLTRRGQSGTVGLQYILDQPSENLVLEPGDIVFVLHNPRLFVVLGAAQKVAQYEFNTERVTLAEAVGRSGGPHDSIANVGELYLLRLEKPEVVHRLRAMSGTPEGAPPLQPISVAYHLDLRHGAGYFLAQQVQMRNKDILLMTNAEGAQLQKALLLLRYAAGAYFDIRSPSNQTIKSSPN